ncbi:MAG TPA: hypothetical protein VFX32_10450 [Pseudolabrys sp.]|nr:hypothetical protein [Pseudolabrys sp.]
MARADAAVAGRETGAGILATGVTTSRAAVAGFPETGGAEGEVVTGFVFVLAFVAGLLKTIVFERVQFSLTLQLQVPIPLISH